MNEITRIHIAKTAYDIEVAAKKQLEKYIKNLELYTQDPDVLEDIEIRMTELLAERRVVAGGVIGSDDVAAIRAQLGEPYEFADEEGDIAIGQAVEPTGRRLYRSTDDAVLGGVLSGVAAYFNVNPLWTRLVFILLLFISFGFATIVYIIFWVVLPPARTAAEKLRLTGKTVTAATIKQLSMEEDKTPARPVAPMLQRAAALTLGSLSALAALGVFIMVIGGIIVGLIQDDMLIEGANLFLGVGEENEWLAWTLSWVIIFGLLLLVALFSLIAYAFFARKLTKKMIISGVAIIILGMASVATVIGVAGTQSMRIAEESRSMVRTTNVTLPSTFANVTSLKLATKQQSIKSIDGYAYPQYTAVRYIVDEGPARYEFSALPNAKVSVATEGTNAVVTIDIPESFRNAFVQPVLTIYGPALQSLETAMADVGYEGVTQDGLTVMSGKNASVGVTGVFALVTVNGSGSVDLGASTIQSLNVTSRQGISVDAGTVRDLTVELPDVCPVGAYADTTNVRVQAISSEKITYNGKDIPAETYRTNCAVVTVEGAEQESIQ